MTREKWKETFYDCWRHMRRRCPYNLVMTRGVLKALGRVWTTMPVAANNNQRP